jgi:protein-tyrosine kinase
MSRIHEALKKAELERSGVQTTELPRPPFNSRPSPRTEEIALAPSTGTDDDMRSTTESVDAPVGLRPEDLRTRCVQVKWSPNPNANVFEKGQNAQAAEQFRTLRSRLYQLRGKQASLKRLLVTSATSGEGKTFIGSNLARAIARQPGRRVLLVDGDLRRSRMHLALGAVATPGLAEFLRGDVDPLTLIQKGQEDGLYFLPAGGEVPDPNELLANGRLKKLFDLLAPIFDWIVIDSPPCLPVADATVIAEICDGALLVVRSGLAPLATVQRARLKFQERNIIGVVLNGANEASATYGSYYDVID